MMGALRRDVRRQWTGPRRGLAGMVGTRGRGGGAGRCSGDTNVDTRSGFSSAAAAAAAAPASEGSDPTVDGGGINRRRSSRRCDPAGDDAVVTPVPPTVTEPLLLLEGDRYHLSESGIARALYQIVPSLPSPSSPALAMRDDGSARRADAGLGVPPTVCIEEIYDLWGARKSFLVREGPSANCASGTSTGRMPLGRPIPLRSPSSTSPWSSSAAAAPLILDEIPAADSATAGTGSRTWDSSIAMAMYFSSRPELLFGDVIELGSGVGLGGILCYLFRTSSENDSVPFVSMTLTDNRKQVLDRCRDNVAKTTCGSAPSPARSSTNDRGVPLDVDHIDWHDFVRQSGCSTSQTERYDTVLACDCAYLYQDIKALVSTMRALPRKRPTSKIHAFGPINRGGMIQLLDELRGDPFMDVDVEVIGMVRHRLETPSRSGKTGNSDQDPLEAVSQYVAADAACSSLSKDESKFLHVTCTLHSSPKKQNDHDESYRSLSEID